MTLYLIRHTSVAVEFGTCYGWTDVPVSDHFEQEAALTKAALADLHLDRVYMSPLTRAKQLAAYCGYADAIEEPRMKEMHMGDWEMKRFNDIHDPELKQYFEHYLDVPTKNGESFRDLYRRVSSFLDDLRQMAAKDDSIKKVAVFCHGGPIICALVYAGLVPIEEGYNNIPDYASVTKIELE